MGLNITKLFTFRKSPDVIKKELEGIDKEITVVEQKKASLECQYHLIMKFVNTFSTLLYFMMSLVFFFSSLPSTLFEYIFFCGPVAMFYILVWGLRKSLKWYFNHEIKECNGILNSLHFRKRSVILSVKENMRYYEAKDIIEEDTARNIDKINKRKQILGLNPVNFKR